MKEQIVKAELRSLAEKIDAVVDDSVFSARQQWATNVFLQNSSYFYLTFPVADRLLTQIRNQCEARHCT